MTRAQLKPFWRAVARAASALGLVGKDAVEEYRHAVMMEEVGATHAAEVNPAAGYDRVMYRLAIDAGDWPAAARYATGEERRMAHLVEQCARQVLELKAVEDGCPFDDDQAGARESAMEYVVGCLRQAGLLVVKSQGGGDWWMDVSAAAAFSVFRMLDTHRRRLLKRYGWKPISFDPDASWRPEGDALAVGPVSSTQLQIHVGRPPCD